ncbi:MAG: C4-dicarboxylate ABC transporter permease [Deltaproteobacteria bacterium RBG_16_48_10]|nr:MAG: C4-dicarboxylate ABC transporter permease [Deltaproteobacteria bacterium RBG_16_48_10]
MNFLIAISFFVSLALGIPIAFVMGITALAALFGLPNVPLHLVPQRLFTGMDSFPIMAVPFFILGGDLMNAAKITDRIIEFSKLLVGRIRGGLGHVNIVGSMFFAGISGSAVADASCLGSILIPAMEKDGYEVHYASAITASAAIIGPIIPPSIPMVVLALVANLSVGALFLGGVLPGVFIGLGLMGVNYVVSRKRNYARVEEPLTFKIFFNTLVGAIIPLLMPLIIMGGILTGIFTPTEAASIAVAYALFVGFFVLRTLTLKDLPRIFFRSAVATSTILMVMAMANAFSWILATQQIPQQVSQFIFSISRDPYVILFLINIFLLLVGCFLEGLAAIILIVPILMPVVTQLGINPIHFGLIVVVNLMIGLLTPPLGLCLFVVCGVAKIKLGPLFKEVFPFLIIEIIILFVITYMPWFTLTLPRLFGLQ